MVIQENIDAVEDDVATLEGRVEYVENRMTDIEERDVTVGFSATLSSNTNLEVDDTFIFDEVLTNYGNAYDSSTGLFTSPMHGLYEFNLFFMKTTSSDQININLQHNGIIMCKALADDGDYHLSGCSAVIELNVGDTVAVKCANAGTAYGDRYSGLNGHLVYLL